MKIGILTFYIANNYGAVLQAYALKEYLKECGHQAYCIDYRPGYLVNKYRPFSTERLYNGNPVKNFFKEIVFYGLIKQKNNVFDLFRKEYLSPLGIKKMHNCDLLIVGSDQIWNFEIVGNDQFFRGNISRFHGTIATYAASMENTTKENVSCLKTVLDNFKYISVREASLQKCLSDVYNTESNLVVDPTLLLSKEKWNKIQTDCKVGKGYILVYMFSLSVKDKRNIENFAFLKNLKTVFISSAIRIGRNFKNKLSPTEFVDLIANADYVITNSFHGTAFSILYNKKFITLCKGASNERVETLLGYFNLDKSMIQNTKQISEEKFMMIETFPDKFIKAIENSKSYLKRITVNIDS